MKRILILAGFVAICILSSCTEGYEETHKDIFSDQVWTKGEVIVYKPVIEETEKSKQIAVDLQHIYGYDIKGMEVLVKIVSPSGKEELAKTYYLRWKEDDGKALSQCSGDYCDLKQVLESSYKFTEKGTYSITIEQATTAESVAGFLSLKLMITDVK